MKHGLPSSPQNGLIVQTNGVQQMLQEHRQEQGTRELQLLGLRLRWPQSHMPPMQGHAVDPVRADVLVPPWLIPPRKLCQNSQHSFKRSLKIHKSLVSLVHYQLQLCLNQWCAGKLFIISLPRLIFSTFYQRRPTQRRHIQQFLQRSSTQAGSDKAAVSRDHERLTRKDKGAEQKA